MKYIIEGGKRLEGSLIASGNKNSTFPCMAAALLTDQEVVIKNVPQIRDTEILLQILEAIGVSINRSGSTVILKAASLTSELPKELTSKLRGSVVLAGAILSRLKKVQFFHPGGDVIGIRSIDVHLRGFEVLGAKVKRDDLKYTISSRESSKRNLEIFFPMTSVTGTENLILASVLKPGITTLKNCTSEPHIVDLCQMLISMGANIEGVGSDKLIIKGAKMLKGTTFKLGVDTLEVGTYAIAAAVSKGSIDVLGLDRTDLNPILVPLADFGLKFKKIPGGLNFYSEKLTAIPKLTTNIWPGFPTDMMSLVIVLATQAKGVTLCHDWIYESRMFFTDKLIAMGANITIADPHRVLVYGPSKLRGRELETPDIRAGMALVLAALIASGKSVINRAELIERGYEDVVEKLTGLGALIEAID